MVTFEVRIGHFRVEAIMLNLPYPCEGHGNVLAKGAFGVIIESSPKKVAKRVYFRQKQVLLHNWQIEANFRELQELLVEYAFNHIAAVLQIGPKMPRFEYFDVVCYQNAAQFYLEKCWPIYSFPTDLVG